MSIDTNKWISTLVSAKKEKNRGKYKLNPDIWVNTLSKINTKNPINKYFLTLILFVVGIMFVSVIKNETRNLQKEINILQASINTLKFDLHQADLDHEVITSPDNISRLAEKYLESDFIYYKKSQIRQLNEKSENVIKLKQVINKKNFKKKTNVLLDEVTLRVAKKIEKKRIKLKKLQKLYSKPEKLPDELKVKVEQNIKKAKNDLKKLYSNPKKSFNLEKAQRWAAVQVVKVFLGIPAIPGK